MRLREAQASDAEGITALIRRCSETFILPEFNENGRLSYLRSHNLETIRGLLNTCAYWVAEHQAHLVGVIGIQNRNHLYHLHVDEAYQRQGIASRLWRRAAGESLPRITVNASRYAVPFYETLGFRMIEERELNGVFYFAMILDRTLQFDF